MGVWGLIVAGALAGERGLPTVYVLVHEPSPAFHPADFDDPELRARMERRVGPFGEMRSAIDLYQWGRKKAGVGEDPAFLREEIARATAEGRCEDLFSLAEDRVGFVDSDERRRVAFEGFVAAAVCDAAADASMGRAVEMLRFDPSLAEGLQEAERVRLLGEAPPGADVPFAYLGDRYDRVGRDGVGGYWEDADYDAFRDDWLGVRVDGVLVPVPRDGLLYCAWEPSHDLELVHADGSSGPTLSLEYYMGRRGFLDAVSQVLRGFWWDLPRDGGAETVRHSFVPADHEVLVARVDGHKLTMWKLAPGSAAFTKMPWRPG